MNEGQEVQSQEPVTPAVQEEQKPQERVFKQSEVNEIVGRVRKEATEKASARVQEEYKQQPQAPSTPEQEIRRMAAEEAQRLRSEWVKEHQAKTESETAQKIVNNFWNKIESGKSKFEDFDNVAGDIELARFPNVVEMLAEHIDNAAEVLYEFGKNRTKLSQLEQLANMSPKDAIKEAKRLSQSIKDNEPNANTRSPNEPLSKTRSSNSGAESGPLSIADLKKKYRA